MLKTARTALALLAALGFAARRVEAQYLRYGFIAAGPGGAPDEAFIKPQFTLAGGFVARFGPPVGVNVGIRTITAYSRFEADAGAYLDSIQATQGRVEGGSATMTEVGVDGVFGYDTGALGGYGWYGIHYYAQSQPDAVITTSSAIRTAELGSRGDLGPSYGAGLQLHVSRRAMVFGEWFIGGGFDDRMIRAEGLRAGIIGVF